jgi:squalene-hopene/tetraprenyl-beta-curcumene cyclase
VIEDGNFGSQPDLDWDAAVKFLSRCQNLAAANDQPWVTDDPKSKGGFAYAAVKSKDDDK